MLLSPPEHGLGVGENPSGILASGPPGLVRTEVEEQPGPVAEVHIGTVRIAHNSEVHAFEPTVKRPPWRHEAEHHRPPVPLPVRCGTPPLGFFSREEGLEWKSVNLDGDVNAECHGDRGQDVDVLREVIDPGPVSSRGSRIVDDATNGVALREESQLLSQTMVAELFAMIGREDDQRVVHLPHVLELIENPPDLGIDFGDHAEVLGAHVATLGLGGGSRTDIEAHRQLVEMMAVRFWGRRQ